MKFCLKFCLEFSSKEELDKPVSDKLSKIMNTLFLTNMDTDINVRKLQLLNVSAAYAVTEPCEKVVSRMDKYKQDLSKELLTPLVDSLGFIGKATTDTNQLRRDILKSRLPSKMNELTKNVPAESELLLGDDLNKRISQINNANSAFAKPAFIRPNQSGRYNKSQVPCNTKQTEQLQELQELNSVSCGGRNVKNFIAGNLKNYYAIWQKITSDRVIPDIIKNGLKISFKERPGITSAPKIPHSKQEIKIINTEIKKLPAKGVIIECDRDKGGFISTIFTRQKKYGSFRAILSSKHLNHNVNYQHLKMESLNDIFKIMKKGV